MNHSLVASLLFVKPSHVLVSFFGREYLLNIPESTTTGAAHTTSPKPHRTSNLAAFMFDGLIMKKKLSNSDAGEK